MIANCQVGEAIAPFCSTVKNKPKVQLPPSSMVSDRESINFKLPRSLTNALRARALELNTTATDLVTQGLNYILGGKLDGKDNLHDEAIQNILNRLQALELAGTDSSTETRLKQLETQISNLDKGVDSGVDNGDVKNLEQKVEDLALRLAKIEGAIAILGQRQGGGGKRQPYNYIPPQMELQPYTADNLGRRLGVDVKTLERERKNLSLKEFESWCRSRDPNGFWWRFENDGFYHPVK